MKYLITLFFLGFFFSASAQWSPQTAARIAAYDSAVTKYYNGHFDNDAREAVYMLTDSLYQFFEDSATVSDLYQIMKQRRYSGFLYRGLNTLHKKGFSKIELFKRFINDTSEFENRSYGCMVISFTDYRPRTQLGAFMRDGKYTELERDSFYQILFNTPNKHEQLQYLELLDIENNSQHLDLIADFARKQKTYNSIIPLIMYRFETEKDFILEVLEEHLFNPKRGSYPTISGDFTARFSETFKVRPNDEAIFSLLIKYWEEKPDTGFLKYVLESIAKRNNEKSLKVLSELYFDISNNYRHQVKSNYARFYDFRFFCELIYENRTPLYHDLCYKIIMNTDFNTINDKYFFAWGVLQDIFPNSYEDSYRNKYYKLLVTYLKTVDTQRYNQVVLDYFFSIKDITTPKIKYTPALDFEYAILGIEDTIERARLLKTFLSAKNDYTVNNAINITDLWLRQSPHTTKIWLPELERIIKHFKNKTTKMLALMILLKHSEENNEILDWYEKNQSTVRTATPIQSKYKSYIEKRTIANTKLYLKTKNVIGLDKIIDSLDKRPYNAAKYEVRDLIKNGLDTAFNEVYYKMLKKGIETSTFFTFLLKNDKIKVKSFIEGNYKNPNIFPVIIDCCSSSNPLVKNLTTDKLNEIIKYWLINGSESKKNQAIRYVGATLRDFPNIKLDISSELWQILEEDFNKKRFSDLTVTLMVLSFDKSQKTKVLNFYKKHFDKLTYIPFMQKYLVKNGVITPKEYMIDNCINMHLFNLYRDYTIIHNLYFRNISADTASSNMKRFLERTDIFEIKSILTYGRNFLISYPNQSLDISQELWNIINNEPSSGNMALAMVLLSYDKKEKKRLEELYVNSKEFLEMYKDFFTIRHRLISNGLSIDD